jgi:hypothetical protein
MEEGQGEERIKEERQHRARPRDAPALQEVCFRLILVRYYFKGSVRTVING